MMDSPRPNISSAMRSLSAAFFNDWESDIKHDITHNLIRTGRHRDAVGAKPRDFLINFFDELRRRLPLAR